MSNTITKRQNSNANIARLAAQRQLYRDEGNIETVNVVLSVIIPLGIAVIQEVMTAWTWAKTASCCLSIAMLAVSIVLSSAGKRRKKLAASIQQEFDIDVFQMPWDEKLFGLRKNLNDEIAGASKKILGSEHEKKMLYDWYTIAVESLTRNKAIAACQKENFNWDAGLRKRFRFFNIALLSLVIIVPVIICLVKQQSVEELLLKFIVVLPALKWSINNITGINEDLKRMEPIERAVYSREEKSMNQLQLTQKDIYMNRMATIKIPDWFYKWFKDNDEDRERRAVELGE
jgi:hypothetical protein